MPAAPKISAQDEATIRARHAAGEPLRAIAPDYGVSHQALSKRLKRARPPLPQQRKRQPQQPAAPAGGRAALSQLSVRRAAAWRTGSSSYAAARRLAGRVDPLAEPARYEQLLAEGFTA